MGMLRYTSSDECLEVQNLMKIGNYERIMIKRCRNPEVSIIIPAYNQFDYTYRCLKSILDNTSDVSYEVIIADDKSNDQTRWIRLVAGGIRHVRNTKNLMFLENCNNAAKHAKGRYILFLNNDTEVHENWLRPLVDIFERFDDAGLVGSKLVYEDGTLQEAGGIIWSDGSAHNYGRGENPESAEFNYVKEVDYISGASIMIKRSLWKEIGGFDKRYAPAYYEDSDLAMEVRKHGKKVYYQPLSVVTHFEGKSNGTDIEAGIKAYQTKNKAKFREKWHDILDQEHLPLGQNLFLERDRAQLKKRIFVLDRFVPNYDKDAGGKCTFMYLKVFLKMGLKVTFLGDDYDNPEPYTTQLNQLGIEVLYGDYYRDNWQRWMCDNLKYYEYAYLQRPHYSSKYIDAVKQFCWGKIFYFGHDLHYKRLLRQYEVTGDIEYKKQADYFYAIEMDLFGKADVIHVVGEYEKAVVSEMFPDKPVRNIPVFIYEDMPKDILKDFSKRKDIMFVGGFSHYPNVDCVLWFAKEVFPKVVEKYPDVVWHIIGGNAPDSIKELSSTNIIYEGYLSDEELEKLYRSCRLSVVPLRVGAGVKGKIIEAAHFQTPVVTTSIGAEGIDNSMDVIFIEDDPVKMAQLICDKYEDYEVLRHISDNMTGFIKKYYSLKTAEDILCLDM